MSVYVLMCSRVMKERRDGHLPRGIGIESMYHVTVPYQYPSVRSHERGRPLLAHSLLLIQTLICFLRLRRCRCQSVSARPLVYMHTIL